jgi:ElaB/YqjD/DUF883 family membrane-anchored ribosome-binding protein
MPMHSRCRAYRPIRPQHVVHSRLQLAACLVLLLSVAFTALRRHRPLSFTDLTLAQTHAFSVFGEGEVEPKQRNWTMWRSTAPELDYSGIGPLQRLGAQIDECLADLATWVDRILGRFSEEKASARQNLLKARLKAKRAVKEARKRAKEDIQAALQLLKGANSSVREDARAALREARESVGVSFCSSRIASCWNFAASY